MRKVRQHPRSKDLDAIIHQWRPPTEAERLAAQESTCLVPEGRDDDSPLCGKRAVAERVCANLKWPLCAEHAHEFDEDDDGQEDDNRAPNLSDQELAVLGEICLAPLKDPAKKRGYGNDLGTPCRRWATAERKVGV